MSTRPPFKIEELRRIAAEQGLALVALAPAQNPAQQEDSARLGAWQEAGYGADMGFMSREPSLYADPRRLLPSLRSIALFAIPYRGSAVATAPAGYGRIARYAWGRDYHRVLKKRLQGVLHEVQRVSGANIQARLFSDAVPFLERAFGARAGLGFIGKNTLLIRPGLGSYFFLGEILWDLECETEPLQAPRGSCGSCQRCRAACPTGALVNDYQLDARLCISYLTIEKQGVLSVAERKALGDWIFGCDLCQEVCPFNYRRMHHGDEEVFPPFHERNGAGSHLRLADLLAIRDDQSFLRQFAGTPLMRPGREGLLRNAVAVAANTGAEAALNALREAAREDSSPIVRLHAIWAIGELTSKREATILRALRDEDPLVRGEAMRIAAE